MAEMLATVRLRSDVESPFLGRSRSRACWNPVMEAPHVRARTRGRLVAWLVFVVALALLLRRAAQRHGDAGRPRVPLLVVGRGAHPVRHHARDPAAHRAGPAAAGGLRAAAARRRGGERSGSPSLALVAIYVAALVYERVLSLFGDLSPTEEQGLVPDGWDSSRAGAFVAFFVVVTFIAPAVEELTYRGLGISLLAAVRNRPRDRRHRRPLRRWRTGSSSRLPILAVLRDRRRLAARAHGQHLPADGPARDVQRRSRCSSSVSGVG